jgi:hypothetical protein
MSKEITRNVLERRGVRAQLRRQFLVLVAITLEGNPNSVVRVLVGYEVSLVLSRAIYLVNTCFCIWSAKVHFLLLMLQMSN